MNKLKNIFIILMYCYNHNVDAVDYYGFNQYKQDMMSRIWNFLILWYIKIVDDEINKVDLKIKLLRLTCFMFFSCLLTPNVK